MEETQEPQAEPEPEVVLAKEENIPAADETAVVEEIVEKQEEPVVEEVVAAEPVAEEPVAEEAPVDEASVTEPVAEAEGKDTLFLS